MVLLLNSIMPTVPVFAEGSCDGYSICVNDVWFTTLSDAVAAATAWQTVEITEAGTYPLWWVTFDKNVTIEWLWNSTIITPATAATTLNSMANNSIKFGTLSEGVTVTLSNVKLELPWNYAWYWFAWSKTNSKVVINNSTVAWRLATFTKMDFDHVNFVKDSSNTNTYNIDVHEWSEINFTACTFVQNDRNVNVYDWNNDNEDQHNVTFNGCTFTTSTSNKWAINIHESHASMDHAVRYNVTITNANIAWWHYPSDTEVIWRETSTSNWVWYFSKIVKADGLVSIDDIRRVIETNWWEITVSVGGETIYSTPATVDAWVTPNTPEELNAIKSWYTSNGYNVDSNNIVSLNSYTVTFNSNWWSAVAEQTVNHGATATEPDPAPTRENSTFVGWQLNGVDYVFSTPITAAITLDAERDCAADYHLEDNVCKSNTKDMACLEPDEHTNYTQIDMPATWNGVDGYIQQVCAIASCKTGYSLENDVCTQVQQTYTLTLDPNGWTLAQTSYPNLAYNTSFDLTQLTISKTWYTLAGWYDGDTLVESLYTVTANKTLTAHWTVNQYTVTFKLDQNTDFGSKSVNFDAPIFATEAEYDEYIPVQNNKIFKGWKLEGNDLPSKMPANSIEVYADWEDMPAVNLLDENGDDATTDWANYSIVMKDNVESEAPTNTDENAEAQKQEIKWATVAPEANNPKVLWWLEIKIKKENAGNTEEIDGNIHFWTAYPIQIPINGNVTTVKIKVRHRWVWQIFWFLWLATSPVTCSGWVPQWSTYTWTPLNVTVM